MKRITLWVAVAVVLVLTALVAVRAEARGRHGWCGQSWGHPGPVSYLAHELKLSDTQRAQIRTLWGAERPAISAQLHEFLAENKEMNAMTAQGNLDQNKIQEIADRESATIATLLVEKEQLQLKIYRTVLDTEQRAKTDELQRKWESRLDDAADRFGTPPAGK
jgi:Spy/CpxP family protein refolding chaperone